VSSPQIVNEAHLQVVLGAIELRGPFVNQDWSFSFRAVDDGIGRYGWLVWATFKRLDRDTEQMGVGTSREEYLPPRLDGLAGRQDVLGDRRALDAARGDGELHVRGRPGLRPAPRRRGPRGRQPHRGGAEGNVNAIKVGMLVLRAALLGLAAFLSAWPFLEDCR
jgi:hypothetical protein